MRNDYMINKIPKKVIRRSTDYVPIPVLTAEEKEKAVYARAIAAKKLVENNPATEKIVRAWLENDVLKYPELFSEERWDKYREPKQEENENDENIPF